VIDPFVNQLLVYLRQDKYWMKRGDYEMKQLFTWLAVCIVCNVSAMDPDQAHEQREPAAIPRFWQVNGVSGEGIDFMNQHLKNTFNGLTEKEHRSISLHLAEKRHLNTYMYTFWKFVSTVSDPITNLGLLACIIMPSFSSLLTGSDVVERIRWATVICSSASLVFKNVRDYAEDKMSSHEKTRLFLLALREPLGEGGDNEHGSGTNGTESTSPLVDTDA
jgi:hypothetical protein